MRPVGELTIAEVEALQRRSELKLWLLEEAQGPEGHVRAVVWAPTEDAARALAWHEAEGRDVWLDRRDTSCREIGLETPRVLLWARWPGEK